MEGTGKRTSKGLIREFWAFGDNAGGTDKDQENATHSKDIRTVARLRRTRQRKRSRPTGKKLQQ